MRMRVLVILMLAMAALWAPSAIAAEPAAILNAHGDAARGSLAGESAILPGPGLGPSKDEPSGEPVTLILPDGYTLERVRGDSGDVPARGGAFDLALVLTFDAASYGGESNNRSACAAEPEW